MGLEPTEAPDSQSGESTNSSTITMLVGDTGFEPVLSESKSDVVTATLISKVPSLRTWDEKQLNANHSQGLDFCIATENRTPILRMKASCPSR